MIQQESFNALPTLAKFQNVSIDCYIGLPTLLPGDFCFDVGGHMPLAYEDLSDQVESTAIASLLDAKSTLVFRLFICRAWRCMARQERHDPSIQLNGWNHSSDYTHEEAEGIGNQARIR